MLETSIILRVVLTMKLGDLVKPLGTCGGKPGDVRCDLAVVLEPTSSTDSYKAKILCGCGSATVYREQLEPIIVGKCSQK